MVKKVKTTATTACATAHIVFIMLVYVLGLFPFLPHVYHVAPDGEDQMVLLVTILQPKKVSIVLSYRKKFSVANLKSENFSLTF